MSVGARLLAGDKLYSEVFDNKEPLFYYLIALQVALGPVFEIVAELALFAVCSLSAYLLLRPRVSQGASLLVSGAAVPLLLSGAYYFPGASHLPGAAIILCSVAAAARGWFRATGACLAVLVFLKLPSAPVGFAAVAPFLVAPQIAQMGRRVLHVIVGFLPVLLVIVALLAVRGELSPFFGSLGANVDYVRGWGPAASPFAPASLLEHLRQVHAVSLFLFLAIIAAGWVIANSPIRKASIEEIRLFASATLALLGAVFVLALTAIWPQHNQILYIPGILMLLALAAIFEQSLTRQVFAAVFVLIASAYMLGGSVSPRRYVSAFLHLPQTLSQLGQLSPETKRLRAFGANGNYARFGSSTDMAHAIGLNDWRLHCPRFHQYDFQPAALLDEVFKCGSTAHYLIVAADLQKHSENTPDWNMFVERVEDLVAADYECDAPAGLRICRRRSAPSTQP